MATADRVLDLLAGRGSDHRRMHGSRTASAVVASLLVAGIRVPASLASEWIATGATWRMASLRGMYAGRWIRARGGPGQGPDAYAGAIAWLADAAGRRWGMLSAREVAWWRRRVADGDAGMAMLRAGAMATTSWHWIRARRRLLEGGGWAGIDASMAMRAAARMRPLERARRK